MMDCSIIPSLNVGLGGISFLKRRPATLPNLNEAFANVEKILMKANFTYKDKKLMKALEEFGYLGGTNKSK